MMESEMESAIESVKPTDPDPLAGQDIVYETMPIDHFKAPSVPAALKEDSSVDSPVVLPELPVLSKTFKSPAEILKTKEDDLPLNYKEPDWKLIPTDEYWFEVLKDGKEIGNIPFENGTSLIVVGRLASCKVQLEHPSISRHHAVLQYGDFGIDQAKGMRRQGWYVYDLGSTHGTVLNKQKVPAKQYIRIHVGHVLKFGGSTRLLILQGPEEDTEEESKLTVSEIKEKAARRKLKAKGIIKDEKDDEGDEVKIEEDVIVEGKGNNEESGAMWGISDDYGVEDERGGDDSGGEEMDMESMQKRESYYRDDPKKILNKFFDREGYDMLYEYEEKGIGFKHQWVCKVNLPMIDTPSGHSLKAEAVSTGSKKEAQVHCALEACRILDAHNILRRASQASETTVKKRNKELKDNDFYDSDEDIFLDRTGELELKREKRKNRLELQEGSAASRRAETYEGLLDKLEAVKREIDKANEEILSLGGGPSESKRRRAEDSLDEYMVHVNRNEATVEAESQENKVKKSRLKLQIAELQKQADRFEKLARIARPVTLPPLMKSSALISRAINSDADAELTANNAKSKMVWVGSMKGHRLRRAAVPPPQIQPIKIGRPADGEDEEEVEEGGETESDPIKQALKNIEERKVVPQQTSTKTYTVELPPSISIPTDPNEEVQDVVELEPLEKVDEFPKNVIEHETVDNKKTRHRRNRKRKDHLHIEVNDYDPNDPDYAMWLPPDDQQGDGSTSLNQKLGY